MTAFLSRFRIVRRADAGATDPILVIAAIAVSLVLLVGGSFAVAGMISNGKNLNAQGDLDKVATAETAATSGGGGNYLNWTWDGTNAPTGDTDTDGNKLDKQVVGFTPTAGEYIVVSASPAGWVAGVKSTSGQAYYRSSLSSTVYKGLSAAVAAPMPGSLVPPVLP